MNIKKDTHIGLLFSKVFKVYNYRSDIQVEIPCTIPIAYLSFIDVNNKTVEFIYFSVHCTYKVLHYRSDIQVEKYVYTRRRPPVPPVQVQQQQQINNNDIMYRR